MANVSPEVEYRPAVGFPKYLVGNDGSLWRWYGGGGRSDRPARWKHLRGTISRDGYTAFILPLGDKYCRRPLHRLVLEAFVGDRPVGMVACHNDGNPNNNALSNLRWDTQAANVADAQRHGRSYAGARHHWAKLTEERLAELIRLVRGGMTQTEAGRRFGISQGAVSMIVRGKTWKRSRVLTNSEE